MKFVLFYNDSAIYVKCNCNSLGKSHKNINPEAPFSRWLRPMEDENMENRTSIRKGENLEKVTLSKELLHSKDAGNDLYRIMK